MATGNYFGINYYQYCYEPTEEMTKYYSNNFPFLYAVGDNVRCRKRHEKTIIGIIDKCAYATEGAIGGQYGGGVIRIYQINNNWYSDIEIKEVLNS